MELRALTSEKVDDDKSGIPWKRPASWRTSRNMTSLPKRVTAAGVGWEEEEAMPKGMFASEK